MTPKLPEDISKPTWSDCCAAQLCRRAVCAQVCEHQHTSRQRAADYLYLYQLKEEVPLSEASCETIRNSLGPSRSALQLVLCGTSVVPTAAEHFMIQKKVACWPTLTFATAATSVVLESVKRYTALWTEMLWRQDAIGEHLT